MNLKLKNYLTNKDLKITNDDFDIEKLQQDLYKDYVKKEDVDKQIKDATSNTIAKSDFEKLQKDYSTLEENYNNQTKILNDTNEKMKKVNFENKLTRKGFQEKDFDDIEKIRNSVYGDEKDDNKAIDEIATKFKNTYFPNNIAPNEPVVNSTEGKDIKISRNTSINDLLIK